MHAGMMVRIKKVRWYLLAALLLAVIVVWYAVYREDRHGILTVTFLDVGQGDAIFIEAPNGNQILLDGGPDKRILRSLGGVMPFYDRSIDLLAISHPHIDHFVGFLSVIPRYDVGGFVSSGTVVNDPVYVSLRDELKARGVQSVALRRGTKVDMGDGVVLDVLLPDRDVANTSPHDGMLVMKLIYDETSILFTGDMEESLENYLASLNSEALKSDVLKVGHHGSKTSTGRAFLGFVSPTYAVISSGEGNMYGHPHEVTLDTLDKFEVKTLRTDTVGNIVVTSDGEEISIR